MRLLLLATLLFITVSICQGQSEVKAEPCTLCLPHIPSYGDDYFIPYNELTFAEDSYVFPSDDDLLMHKYTNHYFGLFNFNDAPNGTFFIGARNILYQFNKTTLQTTKVFNWFPLSSDVTMCQNKASDADVACENYVRLYKKLPFNEERLLVCGTGAFNVTCRTVEKDDINNTDTHGPSTPKLTSGIISLHPLYPFHGDFLDNPNDGYDTTGYFEVDNPESFTMARYNVSYDVDTDAIQFSSTNTRNGVDGIGFSINNPYYPVKLIKQDLDGTLKYKMFYYFIREKKYYDVVSNAVPARARIIRICQNDLGFDDKFYRTFVKFEMLCSGENLKIQAAVGTQEHYYTVLRDVIQTSTPSRWYGNVQVWHIMVYTLFTADVYGPNGTAICVYHAHFTGDNTGFLDLSNRGIIDVFSYNDYKDELGVAVDEENVLDCDKANMRPNNDHLISSQYITQYHGLHLPLLESEGEVYTKLVAEQICVKKNDSSGDCVMQDVLFIGTDDGRVKKIVFSTVSDAPDRVELDGLTHDPIVTQEWKLADDNSIEQIEIQDDNLYIATYSRLYTFPKANCSRHLSCKACLGSRDPYCYWDLANNTCSKVENVGMVGVNQSFEFPSNGLQNVHTGEDSKCLEYPICNLTMSANAEKSFEIIGLDQCNYTNSFEVTIEPYEHCQTPVVTASLTKSDTVVESDDIRGRRLYNVIVTAMGDNGNSSYSKRIMSLSGAPVPPEDHEVTARSINSSFVEVVVSLNGCNIHDELDNYRACVEFIGMSLSCQEYSGVNAFVAGPYNGSQSVNYVVTIENDYGAASASSASISTRVSVPTPPNDLMVSDRTDSSISLLWRQDSLGSNEITGYSIYVNGAKRTDCSTTDRIYTIDGLYSYTQYNFSVVSCSEGGESEQVHVSNITNCGRPSQVQNVYVSSQTSDELTFQWDKPMYTNGSNVVYKVVEQCYNRSSLMIEEMEETDIEETVYTIMELQPLTRCCISVTAVSKCDDRDYQGDVVLRCNITTEGIPGPVEQLTLTPNPDSILVTWVPPYNYTDPSLRYQVRWKPENRDKFNTSVTLDQLYFFIEDLEQSTMYTIGVSAFSSESGPVKYLEGYTLPDVPTRPEDVEITFDQCSMIVNWEHNATEGYDVTNYRIRAYCNEVSFEGTTSSTDRSITFGDICNNGSVALAWCTAQVQASNAVGYGGYSELANEVYPPNAPPSPSCYTIMGIDSTTVFISYTITAPYSLGNLSVVYEVSPTPGETIPDSGVTFNGNNTIQLRKLNRDKKYDFRMRLCSGNRCSNDCAISNIIPPQEPPAPPVNIDTTNVSDNQFTITWDHPPHENYTLLRYLIHVTGRGNSSDIMTPVGVTNYTKVDDIYPDTYYYFVIRSVYTITNLTGRYSDSETVRSKSSSPPSCDIVEIMVDMDGNLLVVWRLPAVLNGTVGGFLISWGREDTRTRSSVTCDEAYNEGNGEDITDSGRRLYQRNLNDTTRDTDKIFVCVRSVNRVGFSSWDRESITVPIDEITTDIGQISNSEGDIGILAGTILFAIIAIVLAIVLVIIVAYCIVTKYNKINSNADEDTDYNGNGLQDGGNRGGEPNDYNDIELTNGKQRYPPTRAESTRSNTSRTVMIKRGDSNEEEQTCCNFV